MAYLGNVANTKEILKKYNLTAQKKFGQNFLIDTGVLEQIVEASDITKDDCVLEIGPGIGTLTQYLAESAGKVIAVEIDKNLLKVLEDTLSDYENVEVINSDILDVDIKELCDKYNNGNGLKVVANLPYYITTPIVMKLLEEKDGIKSITVMVQKEVADRMQEKEGSKEYGALSLAVQYYANPNIVCVVSPSSFVPQPGVDSAVIRLDKYDEIPLKSMDDALLFKIIRAAFSQRRKTLVNGLSNNKELGLDKELIKKALLENGQSETVRGEKLSLEDFIKITNYIYQNLQKMA